MCKKGNELIENAMAFLEFNEYVNVYNKTVSDVNKASTSSQKKHAKLLEAWDKSYEKFFKKNSI